MVRHGTAHHQCYKDEAQYYDKLLTRAMSDTVQHSALYAYDQSFFLDPPHASRDQGGEQGPARAGQEARHEGGDHLDGRRRRGRCVAELVDCGRERARQCLVDFVLRRNGVPDVGGPEDCRRSL